MSKYLHGLFCVALAGVLAGAMFWGLSRMSPNACNCSETPKSSACDCKPVKPCNCEPPKSPACCEACACEGAKGPEGEAKPEAPAVPVEDGAAKLPPRTSIEDALYRPIAWSRGVELQGHWDWADRSEHSKCAVLVTHGEGDRRSGVYCRYGGLVGILSSAVHQKRATVKFPDGSAHDVEFRIGRGIVELAFAPLVKDGLTPLAVSEKEANIVEFMGYGGPEEMRLRHFHAYILNEPWGDTPFRLTTAKPIPGDGGGAFISRGRVVTVQCGGVGKRSEVSGWGVWEQGVCPTNAEVVAFLGDVAEAVDAPVVAKDPLPNWYPRHGVNSVGEHVPYRR